MIRYPLKSTSDKLTDLIVSIRWNQSNAYLTPFQVVQNIFFKVCFKILFGSLPVGIWADGAVLHSAVQVSSL
jgi:hypothetical protein